MLTIACEFASYFLISYSLKIDDDVDFCPTFQVWGPLMPNLTYWNMAMTGFVVHHSMCMFVSYYYSTIIIIIIIMRILRIERILRGVGTVVISSVAESAMVAVWMSFSNVFTPQFWNINRHVLCYSLFSWLSTIMIFTVQIIFKKFISNNQHIPKYVTDCFIIIIWTHLLIFSRSWQFIINDVISDHLDIILRTLTSFQIEQSWLCMIREIVKIAFVNRSTSCNMRYVLWCGFRDTMQFHYTSTLNFYSRIIIHYWHTCRECTMNWIECIVSILIRKDISIMLI